MSQTITDDELLDLAGESSLEQVKELTLRNKKLASFEPYAPKLPSLEALSLSHNQIITLRGFQHLVCLTTLNLNFNALSTLAGIESCPTLTQLYLANNKIRDLQPLRALTGLQTLNLFKNSICSLDHCIEVIGCAHAGMHAFLHGDTASTWLCSICAFVFWKYNIPTKPLSTIVLWGDYSQKHIQLAKQLPNMACLHGRSCQAQYCLFIMTRTLSQVGLNIAINTAIKHSLCKAT